jgi:D-lyxose ketol-isomerase
VGRRRGSVLRENTNGFARAAAARLRAGVTTTPLQRSTVEACIATAREAFKHLHISLPPFARWRVEDWAAAGTEYDEVRDCMLGWDVTDFGSGDFLRIGRTLFTLRNGRLGDPRYPKSYAEKLILDPEGQRAPAHFHRTKREDIINRGGGNILVQLTLADADNQPAKGRLTVAVDGRARTIASGETVRLQPGESVCIPPRTIHQFWGEEGHGFRIDGTGYTVSSEVSTVCDDLNDNFFLADMTRFPALHEDIPRRHYLCHEYPRAAPAAAPR